MGIWGGRRLGFSGYDKELEDCYRCLEILRTYEKRHVPAAVHDLILIISQMADYWTRLVCGNSYIWISLLSIVCQQRPTY
jgi:hypothetical protein